MARNYQTKANVGALPDTITATRFGANEFNSIAVELENAVSTSDQTLAPADGTGEVTDQLAMALAIYGAGGAFYHADTGAVNAYVLTPISPKESPPAYFDGFTVIFEAGTVNTTASTVNVNSLGVKDITYSDGNALVGGELSGSCGIKYNLSDDRFELLFSSGALAGLSQVYVIDASQADQGAASANANTYTVFDAAAAIGTSKNATLYFPHNPVAGNQTLYSFDTSLDLSSYPNLFFSMDPGSIMARTTGDEIFTVNSADNFIVSHEQTLTTVDMIRFEFGGKVFVKWWGAVGDGSTDDVNPIQYAINSVNGSTYNAGVVQLNSSGRYYIGSDLNILQNVALQSEYLYIDFTDRDFWPSVGGSILLDDTATIQMRNGAELGGVLVYRYDMTFPTGGLTATEVALYAGTAVTVYSAAPYIHHCTFLGFERAIDTDTANTPRGRIEYCNIDCTNGIRIDQDLGGWYLFNINCGPLLSDSDADNIRTGIGYEFLNRSDWTTVLNCFAFQDTGFKITDCNQIKMIGAMADHPTDGTDTYLTGIGFQIAGDSVDNFFIGCQTASHEIGFDIDTDDFNANYITQCHIFNMNSTTGIGVDVTGGDVFIRSCRIGYFLSNSGKGIYVNDSNSSVYVLSGNHLIGLTTAIDTPAFLNFQTDNSNIFETISSSVRANEALASVASATNITLPYNTKVIQITGTTTIGTIFGAERQPHEIVTLIFQSALTVNHGNVLLSGSANQAFTAGSTLTIVYVTGNTWYEVGRMIA